MVGLRRTQTSPERRKPTMKTNRQHFQPFREFMKAYKAAGGKTLRVIDVLTKANTCLLYTSPSPRDS